MTIAETDHRVTLDEINDDDDDFRHSRWSPQCSCGWRELLYEGPEGPAYRTYPASQLHVALTVAKMHLHPILRKMSGARPFRSAALGIHTGRRDWPCEAGLPRPPGRIGQSLDCALLMRAGTPYVSLDYSQPVRMCLWCALENFPLKTPTQHTAELDILAQGMESIAEGRYRYDSRGDTE